MRSTFLRSKTPLDVSQLREVVPAAFSDHARAGVSTRYQFLSTERVVNELRLGGLGCFSAKQSGNRTEGKENYARHELRFRSLQTVNQVPAVGDCFPETIIRNSHDAIGGAYLIEAGLYKLTCGNGAVVSIGTMSRLKVVHKHSSIDKVLEAVQQTVNLYPAVIDTVERWSKKELSQDEQTQLAELALGLRYPDPATIPFPAVRLLEARRNCDRQPTLWNVFNRIQENVTQGMSRRNATERGSRRIVSIDSDLKLNRSLWVAAESFS